MDERINVKDLQLTQPYIGRPAQLAEMVDAILDGTHRQGDPIQLLKTRNGIYLFDGNCWSTATYFASEEGGRGYLHKDEFDLYELGNRPSSPHIWIKGEDRIYEWDGEGMLTRKGKGFNLFIDEKVRDKYNNRYYREKTLTFLPELAEKYRPLLTEQRANQ